MKNGGRASRLCEWTAIEQDNHMFLTRLEAASSRVENVLRVDRLIRGAYSMYQHQPVECIFAL